MTSKSSTTFRSEYNAASNAPLSTSVSLDTPTWADAAAQLVSAPTANLAPSEPLLQSRVAVAEGLPPPSAGPTTGSTGGGGGGPMSGEEADLQKRLDALRRD